jgi:hypothetical protein
MTLWNSFAEALRARGFVYTSPGPRASGHSFFGSIDTSRFGAVALELYCLDSHLTTFPKAYLRNPDSEPKRFRFPHINDEYQLCFEDGTVVFNPHDPEAMAEFVLEQIKRTLEIPEIEWDAEIFREFKSYWDPDDDEDYYSEIGDLVGPAFSYELEEGWVGKYLVGSSSPLFNSFAKRVKRKRLVPFCVVPVKTLPSIRSVTWPPKNLLEFQAWLGQASKIRDRFQKAFRGSLAVGSGAFGVLLKCQEPRIQIGVRVAFSESEVRTLRLLARDPELFWGKARSLNPKLFRVLATPLDNERIYSRNAASKPVLSGRRLVLVGCGTLGGHLASILTRSGAATGQGGHLELVDREIYTFENFPRHRIGTHAVGLFKAIELRKELEREAPFISISAYPRSVQDLRVFPQADVVIDATGHEATMQWISRKLQEQAGQKGRKVPLLSLFVHGAGDAVCAFWQAPHGRGCHECLRRLSVALGFYPEVTETQVVDSCQSIYTPYAVDVSLHCATLGFSALRMGLSQERPSSFFLIQKYTDGGNGIRLPAAIEHIPIVPDPDCPACGTNSIPE